MYTFLNIDHRLLATIHVTATFPHPYKGHVHAFVLKNSNKFLKFTYVGDHVQMPYFQISESTSEH